MQVDLCPTVSEIPAKESHSIVGLNFGNNNIQCESMGKRLTPYRTVHRAQTKRSRNLKQKLANNISLVCEIACSRCDGSKH